MSEGCGHCVVVGKSAMAVCKTASNAGGIIGKVASSIACGGVGVVATAACEKVSHCSTTNSAE